VDNELKVKGENAESSDGWLGMKVKPRSCSIAT
jgi:hypothetical protein